MEPDIQAMETIAKLKIDNEKLNDFTDCWSFFMKIMENLPAFDNDEPIDGDACFMGLRADVIEDSIGREELFLNAPRHNGEFFIVPNARD